MKKVFLNLNSSKRLKKTRKEEWALEQKFWGGPNHMRPKWKITTRPYKSRGSQLSESFVCTLDRYKTFQVAHIFLNIFYDIFKNRPFYFPFFFSHFSPLPPNINPSYQNSTVTSSSQKKPHSA